MGIAGQHARDQGPRWWRREDVRYLYALGFAFLLVGVAQIGFAVERSAGAGYVWVGVAYLVISAAWLAVGQYKYRHQQPDAAGD
jgi:hypothetical protein